jgi:hypothetical protein
MTELEEMLAERACERLVLRFHALVDAGDYPPIVALFAADAWWFHRTGVFEGHGQIRRYVEAKSAWPVIRHVLSNILIEVVDADHAAGTAYVTVYYGEPIDEGPPPLAAPVLGVQYDDHFVRSADGWRFASRQTRQVFRGSGFADMVHSKADEQARRGTIG